MNYGHGYRPNRNKYGNTKVTVDGITFDSKKEASRWMELKLMERAGQISDLQRQVEFILVPSQKNAFGKTERKISYVADFCYVKGFENIVEDTKGYKTPEYVMKRKLMLHVWGITIHEI